MQAAPAYEPVAPARRAPEQRERPRFDVYTGQGREANQIVSPAFTHVLKVFSVIAILFFAIGLARVGLATLTTAELNANATVSNDLTAARDQSGDLEVMRSVYGADSRVRDLAEDTLGMVEPSSRITLDLSDGSATGTDAGAATAGTATTE